MEIASALRPEKLALSICNEGLKRLAATLESDSLEGQLVASMIAATELAMNPGTVGGSCVMAALDDARFFTRCAGDRLAMQFTTSSAILGAGMRQSIRDVAEADRSAVLDPEYLR